MTCLALMACRGLVAPALASPHTSSMLTTVMMLLAPGEPRPPQAVVDTLLASGAIEAAVGMTLSCLVRYGEPVHGVSPNNNVFTTVHAMSDRMWQ
jgi:hypothetical protein